MKKLLLLIFSIACIANITNAQEDSTKINNKKDTTKISFGNREINIIESEEGTDIKVRKKDQEKANGESDNENWWNDRKDRKSWRHSGGFRGHWDGVEMGFNGYLNKDYEMSLTGADEFMSLNTSPLKSLNINANFLQVSRNIFGNSFGLVTGLQIGFNNYVFDGNLTIIKKNGVIDSISIPYDVEKSKLTTTYFSIPLLFEFQFPGSLSFKKRMWISAGIIGSIKLESHTKVKYRENGEKKKDKNHDDFNLSVLRYTLTCRMGYSNFYVFGNYSPVQLFEKNKGPELYPFSVGVGLHFR
jgi:hypothetical protein